MQMMLYHIHISAYSNRFEIIPYDGKRPGEGVVIFTHTLTDKPDGPPTNILLQPINATALVASWQEPEEEKVNGRITGYRLVLRTKGGPRLASFVVGSSKRNFTFLDMDVSKPYRLRIAAMSINGTGVFSSWVDSTFSSNPQPPNIPGKLTLTKGINNITLQWEEPQFSGSPVQGYIVSYGQFIPDVFRHEISYKHTNFTIRRLRSDSEYILSLRAFNKFGESKPVYIKTRTKKSVLAKPLIAPVNLNVQTYTSMSLLLSWTDPALVDPSNGNATKATDGRQYMIRYSPITGEAYSYSNTTLLKLELTGLEPATQYEVSVKVVLNDKHSQWSLPVVNSTQHIAPTQPPGNITITSLPSANTEVFLNWTQPSAPHDDIEEYIIYLTSDLLLDTDMWVTVKTKARQVKISDLKPHVIYYFKLQASNKGGLGPQSDVIVYKPSNVPLEARDISNI